MFLPCVAVFSDALAIRVTLSTMMAGTFLGQNTLLEDGVENESIFALAAGSTERR